MNALQKWPGCHSQEETTAQLDLRDLRTQSQSSPAQGPQYSPWNISPVTSRWMGHYPKLSTTAAPGPSYGTFCLSTYCIPDPLLGSNLERR